MPSTASISKPCLSDDSRRFSFIVFASGHWIAMLTPTMIGISSSGTKPSGPPIMKITATKSSVKGKSEMVASVADATKSRTDSNSRN